jgi:uncharacterized membrane protein YbaN (DUF454 family)
MLHCFVIEGVWNLFRLLSMFGNVLGVFPESVFICVCLVCIARVSGVFAM